MADIELRPYQLANDAAPADGDCIITDNATFTDPRQTTKAQFLADEIADRTVGDTAIITGAGLNANGSCPAAPTSSYLKNIDYVAAGYTQDEWHAILLLDAAINSLATSGELDVIIHLSSAELLALFSTPTLKLNAPAAGRFYHITEIVAKNTFGTVPYACDVAGITLRFVGTVTPIVTLPQAFVQLGATTRKKFLVASHEIPLATGIEAYAETSDPTGGDGTIDIIVRYEVLADFTGVPTSTSACCIVPVIGTFVQADLDGAGSIVIHHQLNTVDIQCFIMDNNGTSSQYDFTVGDAGGADTMNYVTVPIGVAAGTWRYLIMAVQ